MKKYLVGAIFSLGIIVSPAFTHAAGLTDSQIQAILSLLSSFGADSSTIANVNTTLTGGTPSLSSSSKCVALSNSLSLDDTDSNTDGDVSKLQKFLAQDSSIYPEARITGYFGPATERAVQRWQAYRGIVSSGDSDTTGYGYIGPKTRAAMTKGCGDVPQTQPPQACPMTLAIISCQAGYHPGGVCSQECVPDDNGAPVVNGIDGPASLDTGQIGKWTVNASVPNQPGAQLSYSVVWGDESYNSGSFSYSKTNESLQTSATFTHTYAYNGTYKPKFTVSNSAGSASAEMAITIGGTVTPNITVGSPGTGLNVVQGQTLRISWNAQNAPTGSAVALWLTNPSSSGNVVTLIKGQQSTTGTYDWVVPTTYCEQDVCGMPLKEGSYTIDVTLYTPSNAYLYGFPSANAVNATKLAGATSGIFTITGSGTMKPNITVSPSSGTLTTSGSPTLWVETNVSDYTPQGNEIVDFGDGSRYALGYTTTTNNRHDYHAPGIYTVKLMNGTQSIASTQVTVTNGIALSNNTRLTVKAPVSATVGSSYTIEWGNLSGPTLAQLASAFPTATGELIAYNNDQSLGVAQTVFHDVPIGILLNGNTQWKIDTLTNDGRQLPSGTYSLAFYVSVPNAGGSTAIAQGNSTSISLTATPTPTKESVDLKSVNIQSDGIRVVYSKNFDTCVHLVNQNYQILHTSNYFCAQGSNDIGVPSPSNLSPNVQVGQQVKLCHGNNYNICSNLVTVTGTTASATIDQNSLTAIAGTNHLISGTATPPGSSLFISFSNGSGGSALVLNNGTWEMYLPTDFSTGTYKVTVQSYSNGTVGNTVLATGTLTVNPSTSSTSSVDMKVNGSDGPITLSDNQSILVSLTTKNINSTSCTISNVRAASGTSGQSTQIPMMGNFNEYSFYSYVPSYSTSIGVQCTGTDGSSQSDNVYVTSSQSQSASALNAFGSAAQTVAEPSPRFNYVWNNDLQIGSQYIEDVKAIQTVLTKEGVYTGDITGGFYSQTYLAVKDFQTKYGIGATGYVGMITRAKLNTLYAK